MAPVKDICRMCLQNVSYDNAEAIDLDKLKYLINIRILPRWDLTLFKNHLICNICIDNFCTIRTLQHNLRVSNSYVDNLKKHNKIDKRTNKCNLRLIPHLRNISKNYQICRCCIKPTKKVAVYLYDNIKNILPAKYIKDMIKCINIPMSLLEETLNPILCFKCWQNIQISYSFHKHLNIVAEKIKHYQQLLDKTYIDKQDLEDILHMWHNLGTQNVPSTPESPISIKKLKKNSPNRMPKLTPAFVNDHSYFNQTKSAFVDIDSEASSLVDVESDDEMPLLLPTIIESKDIKKINIRKRKKRGRPPKNIIKTENLINQVRSASIAANNRFRPQTRLSAKIASVEEINSKDLLVLTKEEIVKNKRVTNKKSKKNIKEQEYTFERLNFDNEIQENIVQEEVQIKREIVSDSDDDFVEEIAPNPPPIISGENCPNIDAFIKSEPIELDDEDEPPELEFQGLCNYDPKFTIFNTFSVDEKRNLINNENIPEPEVNQINKKPGQVSLLKSSADKPLIRVKNFLPEPEKRESPPKIIKPIFINLSRMEVSSKSSSKIKPTVAKSPKIKIHSNISLKSTPQLVEEASLISLPNQQKDFQIAKKPQKRHSGPEIKPQLLANVFDNNIKSQQNLSAPNDSQINSDNFEALAMSTPTSQTTQRLRMPELSLINPQNDVKSSRDVSMSAKELNKLKPESNTQVMALNDNFNSSLNRLKMPELSPFVFEDKFIHSIKGVKPTTNSLKAPTEVVNLVPGKVQEFVGLPQLALANSDSKQNDASKTVKEKSLISFVQKRKSRALNEDEKLIINKELDNLESINDTNPFVCKLCDFDTTSFLGARTHLFFHSQNSIELYHCSECAYRSTKKRNFTKHMMLVHGENRKNLSADNNSKVSQNVKKSAKCDFCALKIEVPPMSPVFCSTCSGTMHSYCFFAHSQTKTSQCKRQNVLKTTTIFRTLPETQRKSPANPKKNLCDLCGLNRKQIIIPCPTCSKSMHFECFIEDSKRYRPECTHKDVIKSLTKAKQLKVTKTYSKTRRLCDLCKLVIRDSPMSCQSCSKCMHEKCFVKENGFSRVPCKHEEVVAQILNHANVSIIPEVCCVVCGKFDVSISMSKCPKCDKPMHKLCSFGNMHLDGECKHKFAVDGRLNDIRNLMVPPEQATEASVSNQLLIACSYCKTNLQPDNKKTCALCNLSMHPSCFKWDQFQLKYGCKHVDGSECAYCLKQLSIDDIVVCKLCSARLHRQCFLIDRYEMKLFCRHVNESEKSPQNSSNESGASNNKEIPYAITSQPSTSTSKQETLDVSDFIMLCD